VNLPRHLSPVELRPLSTKDAPELLELYLRNREFLEPFDPERPDSFFTMEGQRADLARTEAERDADRSYGFGIVDQSDGSLAGRITLSSVVRGAWQNANLGYWVDEGRGGRGFASAAVSLAVGFAFDRLALHRVQAAVMPRNERSWRVLERNGFRLEGLAQRYLNINGVWEDHRIYARTREERLGPG
jgi:ribosomal-protein-alanine N-acetyltransferase